MPRYEHKDENSHLFWVIELEGTRFTTRYGKVGSDGRTSTKEWDSANKARREYEKIINAKVKKGYALVENECEAVNFDLKENPDLEEVIVADPNDEEAWQVYGDWLESEGDPRGEMISIEIELERLGKEARGKRQKQMKARKQVLEQYESDWLGGLAKEQQLSIDWRYGFIWRAEIWSHWQIPLMQDMLTTLLGLPVAKFIQELSLGPKDDENDYCEELDIIARAKPRSLRRVSITGFPSSGNVGQIYHAVPNLEKLTIEGGAELGTLKHDKPKSLTASDLDSSAAKSIAGGNLPELTYLQIQFGLGSLRTVDDLSALFAGKGYPKLKHLGLRSSELQNEIAHEMVNAEILLQLETLDLSESVMTHVGARALLENAQKLEHLKSINLSKNFIPDSLVVELNEKFGDKIRGDLQGR